MKGFRLTQNLESVTSLQSGGLLVDKDPKRS